MKNRQTLIIASAIGLAILVTLIMFGQLSKANSRLESAQKLFTEIQKNKESFMEASARVTSLEARRSLTSVGGVAQAVEEVMGPLGLKDKVTSVKPVPSTDLSDDRAEVVVEGLDINEMTNALYTLNNAPMLIVIRKAKIKTSFLNPGQLDLTMTLSLMKPEKQ